MHSINNKINKQQKENIMNKTANKTQSTKDIQPVRSLADQVPFMPEPHLWAGIFATLENKYWTIHTSNCFSMDKRRTARDSFQALGLTCKALYEIYLPQKIYLYNREIEHCRAIFNSNKSIWGW